MKKKQYFNLHANCIPVKGFSRSLVCDIFFNSFEIIPNELYNILKKYPNAKISEIKKGYDKNVHQIINEYFLFLEEKGWIHYFKNKTIFPKINLDYKEPFIISNAIYEFSDFENFNSFISYVDDLSITSLIIIINNHNIDMRIDKLISNFKNSSIKHLELYFKNYIEIDEMIFYNEPRICRIKIFNANKNEKINIKNGLGKHIEYTNKIFNFQNNVFFKLNINLFSESQKHHNYFNRKLYISSIGEIKNAPECDEIQGYLYNVKTFNDLKQIIETHSFQKYWFVHKEITDVCKDCEFRFMCIENRIPIQRNKNEWFHKIECKYNPYIAKWEGEEGYQTLEECGVLSNEKGFSIDHEKIAKINAVLWDEEDIENK